jgi:hypothetical protein
VTELLIPLVGGPLDGAMLSHASGTLEAWIRMSAAGGVTLYRIRFESGSGRLYRYDWFATKLARAHEAAEGVR